MKLSKEDVEGDDEEGRPEVVEEEKMQRGLYNTVVRKGLRGQVHLPQLQVCAKLACSREQREKMPMVDTGVLFGQA